MASPREVMLAAQGHVGAADVSRSHNIVRRREVPITPAAFAQAKTIRPVVPCPAASSPYEGVVRRSGAKADRRRARPARQGSMQ